VVIVDDHAEFRRSATTLLDADGFAIIGEADDAPQAIERVAALQPDIVLLDIQLPGLDGFDVAQQLCAGENPPLVVLISSREARDYGSAIDGSPARGFLHKSQLSCAALAELIR
jgi:DNA-binding NarL/FixJ family response regulator